MAHSLAAARSAGFHAQVVSLSGAAEAGTDETDVLACEVLGIRCDIDRHWPYPAMSSNASNSRGSLLARRYGALNFVLSVSCCTGTPTEVVNALAPDASHPGKIKPRRDIADETITHVPGRSGQSDITLHEYRPDIWACI